MGISLQQLFKGGLAIAGAIPGPQQMPAQMASAAFGALDQGQNPNQPPQPGMPPPQNSSEGAVAMSKNEIIPRGISSPFGTGEMLQPGAFGEDFGGSSWWNDNDPAGGWDQSGNFGGDSGGMGGGLPLGKLAESIGGMAQPQQVTPGPMPGQPFQMPNTVLGLKEYLLNRRGY